MFGSVGRMSRDEVIGALRQEQAVGDSSDLFSFSPRLLQHPQLAFERPPLLLLMERHLEGKPGRLGHPLQPTRLSHSVLEIVRGCQIRYQTLRTACGLDLAHRVLDGLAGPAAGVHRGEYVPGRAAGRIALKPEGLHASSDGVPLHLDSEALLPSVPRWA